MPLSPVLTDPAAFPPTVTEADAKMLRDLEGKLPPGWMIDVEILPELDWAATVHREEVPISETLMFVVFRWPDNAICNTRWKDGTMSIMDGVGDLAAVLSMIPAGISGGLEAAEAEGWEELVWH